MSSKKVFVAFAIAALVGVMAPMATAQTVDTGEWINLYDGESTMGWTQFGDGAWESKDGVLTSTGATGGWLASTCQFTDFELSAKIKVNRPGTAGIVVRAGLEDHHSRNGGAQILVGGQEGDSAWSEVTVTAIGSQITATVDGKAVEGLQAGRERGYIGIQVHKYHRYKGLPTIEVSEIKLRPISLTAIFNGKDLSGWNIIPGKASKFNVVEGAINITDGNGQIETDKLYRDFLVQMDIISNGEHLNSGVFYRGPKGVFWKGYESQVRNQWMGDDRTKPVDFGTGGIYGVQESRKVVTSDHEWFNKTIVCEGNHVAVWLNGYMVSDLYDTRAVSDEGDGKNGFVDEPGTIHLQGHDPTTDLSFKNINIQEY